MSYVGIWGKSMLGRGIASVKILRCIYVCYIGGIGRTLDFAGFYGYDYGFGFGFE